MKLPVIGVGVKSSLKAMKPQTFRAVLMLDEHMNLGGSWVFLLCVWYSRTIFCSGLVYSPYRPYHPWDWYISLHEWLIFMVNVGKYTSPMDPKRAFFKPASFSSAGVKVAKASFAEWCGSSLLLGGEQT